MQTLGEIKALLAARGIRPKHRFGQNFLHDRHQLRKLVDAAAVRAGPMTDYPKLQAFLARIVERPAYQRAEQRGGALDLIGGAR